MTRGDHAQGNTQITLVRVVAAASDELGETVQSARLFARTVKVGLLRPATFQSPVSMLADVLGAATVPAPTDRPGMTQEQALVPSATGEH
jgi:hypothetical protein